MTNFARRVFESGVPNLDIVLGGGIPEGDLLLVIGAPGSGKTTLVFQVALHAAALGRKVVYVSTLSEPASRLLKHLRTFSFWDERLLGESLFLESIYPVVKEGVEELTDALVEAVRRHGADLLVLDGLMTIRDLRPGAIELRTFVNDLAVAAAAQGCTTILTSAFIPDMRGDLPPELTMCDGVVELGQRDVGPSTVRTLRAWKVRGAENLLGMHTVHIARDGLHVHPRAETYAVPAETELEPGRVSTGEEELDRMMYGGLPRGSVSVLAGGPGTGKTLMALQYLLEGARRGQPGLLVGFRESPRQLLAKARAFGLDLEAPVAQGLLTIARHVPVDLDPDRVLGEMWATIDRTGALRLAVDSTTELEVAIIDERRRRGVMAAWTEGLRARGVTAVLARETGQIVGPELDFTGSPLEVLGENVILLRYVVYRGRLARIVSILKMRDSDHDRSIREYELGHAGLRVLSALESPEGVLGGIARLASERRIVRGATASSGGEEDET